MHDGRIMPGRNEVRAVLFCKAIEGAELHFTVAHHVRVRCSSCFVLSEEVINNSFLVLCCRIKRMKWYAEPCGHPHRILSILSPRAGHPGRIPALDKDSCDKCTCLLQKRGGDGRIHAAREPHEHLLSLHIHVYRYITFQCLAVHKREKGFECKARADDERRRTLRTLQ